MGKIALDHARLSVPEQETKTQQDVQTVCKQYDLLAQLCDSLRDDKQRKTSPEEILAELLRNDRDALRALRSAADSALKRISQPEHEDTEMEVTSPDSVDSAVGAGESDEGGDGSRASIHEEEAAQALTGLRRSSSPRVVSIKEDVEAAMNAAANGMSSSQQLPRSSPFGLHSGFQAPPMYSNDQTSVEQGISRINAAYHHYPDTMYGSKGGLPPAGSPSSLPSLFSRQLLAPIASPADNDGHKIFVNPLLANATYANGQLTPLGQSWRESATPTASSSLTPAAAALSIQAMNAAGLHHVNNSMNGHKQQTDASPASLTPVTGFYRTYHHGNNGQASPVKRKSITTKQVMNHSAALTGVSSPMPTPKGSGGFTMGIAPVSTPTDRSLHPNRKANPRRWTKEEDDALRRAVESHREKNWKAIAAQVPGRNHTQCLQRWTKVLAPGLVKGHWSPHEDDLLRRLVANDQKNWGDVAAKIPGRTSKQCRERWHNHLDPSIVRGAYTPEEDRIILEAQARLGNRWSVIAAMLPGRTEDAVKIRWKSHCRVWRARKYLRKSPAEAGAETPRSMGNPGDDDDDEDTESETATPTSMGSGPNAFSWEAATAQANAVQANNSDSPTRKVAAQS